MMLPVSPLTHEPPRSGPAWKAALALEANFLSEMLKSAGFGTISGEFGGGEGAEQFTSFLREAHAEALVQRGGIGLAEHIYQSLLEKQNGA